LQELRTSAIAITQRGRNHTCTCVRTWLCGCLLCVFMHNVKC